EEVNEEITILEKQLADERKAQLAEQQARDAANKIRLDAIRQKREAAQAEAQRLKEEQERLALAQRVQATQLHREQQRAADQADIDTKTARLVARVTPILEAVRTALVEVRELKRQHELSLRALMNLDVLGNDVPVPWDHDASPDYS